MKKLIIKHKGMISARELEDVYELLKKQLDSDGFALIDNRFEVYEIDTEQEPN